MTNEQEKHLQSIKEKICELIDVKYRKGVEEHGGNLWEKPLDWFEKEIENEIVDLSVYFITRKLLKENSPNNIYKNFAVDSESSKIEKGDIIFLNEQDKIIK